MRKIRTLIVDDEQLAREGLRLLIQDDSQIEIIAECANGHEAVRAMQAEVPDLLFLDVQMPEMNGFEVLDQIGSARLPTVIFVTAYDNYALQAFEKEALDYLLKPFSDERFYKALAKAKGQIEQAQVKAQNHRLRSLLAAYRGRKQETSSSLERLVIKSGGRVLFLNSMEIDWIEAADYYVLLHVGGKSHLLRETMAELEARLDSRKFLRIHRSTIINIERVKEVQANGQGNHSVILSDGTILKLSRRRRDKLQSALRRSS